MYHSRSWLRVFFRRIDANFSNYGGNDDDDAEASGIFISLSHATDVDEGTPIQEALRWLLETQAEYLFLDPPS